MKFNIYFTLKTNIKTMEVPNSTNPVECVNLAGLLVNLASNLPTNEYLGIETVGIRIEEVK